MYFTIHILCLFMKSSEEMRFLDVYEAFFY